MAPGKIKHAERILDKALELGEQGSWEKMHLHAVAHALNISLEEIRQHFAQKDDLVEAWFDRADKAVLDEAPTEGILALSIHERLHHVIMTWLDTLAPHRRLSREMLAYKLEFGHIHLQALGIMRVSRTVQWFREAAVLEATGLQRIVEESTLTPIYLAAFARWLFDDSPGSRRTQQFLAHALRQWESIGHSLCSLLTGSSCGYRYSGRSDANPVTNALWPTRDGEHNAH
jgi:AcrR family transcriptional regulator